MLFNSYIFILLFLPLAWSGYFFLNAKKKYEYAKYFLTGMSLWFYAYFNVSYLWVILASILMNYVCHLKIAACLKRGKSIHNFWCGLGVLFNLGLLFYFKYYNFFIENINYLFHTSLFLKNILLPLGISFFSFQQIAFLVDVRRGDIKRQPICDYMLFVTFFPQLIAGPIVNYREMMPQFNNLELKHIDYKNIYTGFCIFVIGLAKKVLLADTLGQAVNWGYRELHLLSGFSTILVIIFYALQIYFDFSGYCDMAAGIGYLFNLRIPVNFISPYKAENIPDFWNRWHITLTRFFTRYLYVPLGGNRRGRLRTYLNILIVFLISGIWHGAGYTFILWGLLHGIMNIAVRIFHDIKKHLPFIRHEPPVSGKLRKILAEAVTFAAVSIAWVFFRADSVDQALTLLSSMFRFHEPGTYGELATFFDLQEIDYIFKALHLEGLVFVPYFSMACHCLISAWLIWGCKGISETGEWPKFKPTLLKCMLYCGLLLWCLLSFSGVSIFLYFNF